MPKAMKCPKSDCRERFMWDACKDTLITRRGNLTIETVLRKTKTGRGIEVVMHRCPNCKVVIGFTVNDPNYGGDLFIHPEWEGKFNEDYWL